MESQTKAKLNGNQLQAIIAKHFGSDTVILQQTELHNGWFNTAYDLALSSGNNVILKVAPEAGVVTLTCEKNTMKSEVGILWFLRSQGVLPVPEVYAYNASFDLVPSEYFLMEKMEGEPYNLIRDAMSEREREQIEYEMGRYNRQINEIQGRRFGGFFEDGGNSYDTWREAFAAMMSDLLADGRELGVVLPAPYEAIEEEVDMQLQCLDVALEPRLLHWDLWNGNVFVKEGHVNAIIDWERAFWGDPLFEFYFSHMENSEAFYQGYGRRFDSPNELQRRKLYNFYLDLLYVIECYSRQYGNPDHLKWAHENAAAGWARFKS